MIKPAAVLPSFLSQTLGHAALGGLAAGALSSHDRLVAVLRGALTGAGGGFLGSAAGLVPLGAGRLATGTVAEHIPYMQAGGLIGSVAGGAYGRSRKPEEAAEEKKAGIAPVALGLGLGGILGGTAGYRATGQDTWNRLTPKQKLAVILRSSLLGAAGAGALGVAGAGAGGRIGTYRLRGALDTRVKELEKALDTGGPLPPKPDVRALAGLVRTPALMGMAAGGLTGGVLGGLFGRAGGKARGGRRRAMEQDEDV